MTKKLSTRTNIPFGAIATTLAGIALISGAAFAGTAGDVATSALESLAPIAKLIKAAAYVAGIGLALAGMMKFKAHKDNPTQVPLSQPIVLLCIAAGLIFIPTVIDTVGETIFKGGKKTDIGDE